MFTMLIYSVKIECCESRGAGVILRDGSFRTSVTVVSFVSFLAPSQTLTPSTGTFSLQTGL